MSDAIRLQIPTLADKAMVLEYKAEHFSCGEKMIDGSALLDRMDSYEEWLERITKMSHPETVTSDWVLSDIYLAIRQSDRRMVGIIDLRHTLNDFLKNFGHIGYSVRPSERRKGYATKMLELVLLRAKECGLSQVQLSCLETNTASIKTILHNGGIFERDFSHKGMGAKVYSIRL